MRAATHAAPAVIAAASGAAAAEDVAATERQIAATAANAEIASAAAALAAAAAPATCRPRLTNTQARRPPMQAGCAAEDSGIIPTSAATSRGSATQNDGTTGLSDRWERTVSEDSADGVNLTGGCPSRQKSGLGAVSDGATW